MNKLAYEAGVRFALEKFSMIPPEAYLENLRDVAALATPIVGASRAPHGKRWAGAGGATLGGLVGSLGGGALGSLATLPVENPRAKVIAALLGTIAGGTAGAIKGHQWATR